MGLLIMIKILVKVSLGIIFLLAPLAFYAQKAPSELVINTPINTEFNKGSAKGGHGQHGEKPASETSVFFTVRLSANQTARIEAEHDGMDILVFGFNPAGERYFSIESPSGKTGKKIFLVPAESEGLHKIEIRPLYPFPRTIRLRVELKEIRATAPKDFEINKAYGKMVKLSQQRKSPNTMTISELRGVIEDYYEVLRLSRFVEDKYWEGEAFIMIGSMHWTIGEYQSTLDQWLQARELFREIGHKSKEGLAVNNLGTLYNNIGEYERAISYFRESKELRKETSNRYDDAAIFANIASSFFSLRQYEQAIEYTERALKLYEAMKLVGGQAEQTGALGQIYIKLGEYERGIEYLQKSFKLAEASKNRQQMAVNFLQLGTAYKETERLDEADEVLLQAVSLAQDLGNRRAIVSTYYRLAQVARERGKLDIAVQYLEKGLEIIEKIRSELKSKSQRTSYFSTVQNFYELYTDLLIERSDGKTNSDGISKAFEISERSRSRSLVELLQEARVDFKKGVDPNLLEKEKNLTNKLDVSYRKRERLLRRKSTKEKIDEVEKEINNLILEIENLNLQIQRESPQYANLTRGKSLSTKEIQKLLDKETVLLEYKLGEKRSFLWLVTSDSINFHELPKRKEIEKKAREFYDLTIANKRENLNRREELSRHLNDLLLSPVRSEIEGKRLAIVAEGILQYLPFSALKFDESSFLADNNEIVILPSASVLAELRQNETAQKNKMIAIFADPVFDRGDARIGDNQKVKHRNQNIALNGTLRDFSFGEALPRLLASRMEAQNISKLVSQNKATVRTDFEASLANIENDDLKDHRILHFATHGLLNTNRPELSGLVFSLYDKNGQQQDGFLTLNDIYNLNLSSDMIVLSACQTALGKDVKGEGLIGISRGFLYAGSKRIVASLWKVDDSATAEFMKRFYQNHLQKGMPASKALQQTKIEMRKIRRYRSPFYWSAFTLLGDWK